MKHVSLHVNMCKIYLQKCAVLITAEINRSNVFVFIIILFSYFLSLVFQKGSKELPIVRSAELSYQWGTMDKEDELITEPRPLYKVGFSCPTQSKRRSISLKRQSNCFQQRSQTPVKPSRVTIS